MNGTYEAGIRFSDEAFVRFNYDPNAGTVAVTVITGEAKLSGTATLEAERTATRKKVK